MRICVPTRSDDAPRRSHTICRSRIDTLRGIAILLVVALHATASTEQPRLSTVTSPYEYLGYSLSFIRLPLFTVLSGFVYGLRPVRAQSMRRFRRGKLRRLGLPLLTVTLAMFGLRAVLGRGPSGLGDLVTAFVMPYEHLWYLPALAWVFAVVATLDVQQRMQARGAWARILMIAIAVHVATNAIGWTGLQTLSLAGAIYLLPSFLLGLGLSRFPSLRRGRALLVGAMVVAGAGLLVQQLVFFERVSLDVSKSGVLSVFVGLAACLVLLRTTPSIGALARLGRQSYPVYLLHGMGIAFGTRLLDAVHPGSIHVHFLAVVACGVVLPLLGAAAVRSLPWGRTLVLGERPAAPGFGRLAGSRLDELSRSGEDAAATVRAG